MTKVKNVLRIAWDIICALAAIINESQKGEK